MLSIVESGIFLLFIIGIAALFSGALGLRHGRGLFYQFAYHLIVIGIIAIIGSIVLAIKLT